MPAWFITLIFACDAVLFVPLGELLKKNYHVFVFRLTLVTGLKGFFRGTVYSNFLV